MYSATITSQGQITIPAAARRKVGLKPGDRVTVMPLADRLAIVKEEGWDSLRGVLSKFKGNYPTQDELARAHVSGLKLRQGRYAKNTGGYQRVAQIPR
jgi:AbrB family looped-hinge helix DNA binding protein